MRRFFVFLSFLLLLISLVVPVGAESIVQNADIHASVSQDGSGTVQLQLQFYADKIDSELIFPVPGKARNVVVNGSRLKKQETDTGISYVDISHICTTPGLYSLNISFSLSSMVSMQEEDIYGDEIPKDKQQLMLSIPLLSGFAYPVKAMTVTVTLPRELSEDIALRPVFYSGYHQDLIEKELELTYSGTQVTAVLQSSLKGRETLRMEMPAKEMFPRIEARRLAFGTEELIMCVLAALAVLYWVFFLRAGVFWPSASATPPEGINAGHVRTILTGRGTDLTMMVISWAQMGYLLIHKDDHGRVMLHKRMEMGNERSSFENRCFRSLFGHKKMVDGTGYHYAQLYRKIAADRSDGLNLFRRRSGNPGVLRFLGVVMGMFGGVSLAVTVSSGSLLFGLAITLFALACGILSFLIQYWAVYWHQHRQLYLISLLCAGLWIYVANQLEDTATAVCVVVFQLLVGFAAAYGGLRTESGKRMRRQILGLRKYLKARSKKQLRSVYRADPEYFFALLPYAIALGVAAPFAKGFGPTRLPACPFLTTGMDAHMTALEWSKTIIRVTRMLNARQQRLPIEKLLNR